MSIYLTALVKCKTGEANTIKPFLLNLVAASLKEEACLQYELTRTAKMKTNSFSTKLGEMQPV